MSVWLICACLWVTPFGPVVQPSPAGNRWANMAVAASMVTAGIDYGVTMYATGKGFQEAHPLWKPLVDKPVVFGAVKLGTAALTSYLLLKMPKRDWKRKLLIASVITAVNVWAISHNARVLRENR